MIEKISKPKNKEQLKITGSPATPLDDIDASLAIGLDKASHDIEMIKSSLKDLAQRIQSEKPDVVVFLDLSARIFGTPYLRYLKETMREEAPLIRFYNDQDLKGKYLHDEPSDDLILQDSTNFRGRKVFFVDETFSSGKGAVAIEDASAKAGIDAYYFALSRAPRSDWDNEDDHNISKEAHLAKVDSFVKEGRIIVYENPIQTMFSRFAVRLYVQDWQGKTLPISDDSEQKSENVSTLPNANNYIIPPEDMSLEEYSAAITERKETFVRTIKEKIYEALKSDRSID
jgi:adenine/guanine phosphoribosyltransferase-like PRPP-binding protein